MWGEIVGDDLVVVIGSQLLLLCFLQVLCPDSIKKFQCEDSFRISLLNVVDDNFNHELEVWVKVGVADF